MKVDIWESSREKAKEIKHGNIKVLIGETVGGRPSATIWRIGKSKNPICNYSFRNKTLRWKTIRKFAKSERRSLKINKEWQEEKKQARLKAQINGMFKKGDLFYTSWGYDQTNYDYIVILEASPTGKTVKCQRTSCLNMGQSCQSNVQEPIFCPFGEVFRLKVTGEDRLQGSYPYLHTGEGSKRYGYFSRHITGKQYHETDAMYGH